MTMTKEMENKLVAVLQSGDISVPKLQYELGISYRDAWSLIKYAMGHKWIDECTEGIDFPIIASEFDRKDIPEDLCKTIYDKLRGDDLNVLYYLGARFNATFADIVTDVDDDVEDMQNALERLIASKLIFKHELCYYCKISEKSIETVKKSNGDDGESNGRKSDRWNFFDDD